MKQKKLSKEWNLEKGNKVKINNKIFTVLSIDSTGVDEKYSQDVYFKTIDLNDNYAIEINQDNILLSKIIRPNKNTKEYKTIKKLNSSEIEIIKSK